MATCSIARQYPLFPRDFPGNNTGVGCHLFLQRIFLTQGWNLGLLHCKWILYLLTIREAWWWGWQVVNQKQMNMTQMAQQSHRHGRQDESTESGTCPVVPTLTALGPGGCSGYQPSDGGSSSPSPSSPEVGNSFLLSLIPALPHLPPFYPFGSFISYVTNSLHGTPSPMTWVLFSWLIHTDPWGCAQRKREPGATFLSLVKGVQGMRYFETSWEQSLLFFLFVWTS